MKLLALVLVGCAAAAHPPTTRGVELGELALYEDGAAILKIHNDGTIAVRDLDAWTFVGRVRDGAVRADDQLFRIGADGGITRDGHPTGFAVVDHTLAWDIAGDRDTWNVDDAGKITWGDTETSFRVTGVSTPGRWNALALAFVAFAVPRTSIEHDAIRARAEAACPRVARPHFYRIEKAGKTSYLLGTRHAGVSFAKMPDDVRDRVLAAKQVVFEVAPDDTSGDEPPPEPHLSTQLGPELWKRYRGLVGLLPARDGDDETRVGALMGLVYMYENTSASLESEIRWAATAAKIPLGGLETHQAQRAVLRGLVDARLLRAVVAAATRKGLVASSERDLAEYCAGTATGPKPTDPADRKVMHAHGFTDAEIDAFDERLVYGRNRAWLPKLEALLATGDVVVVVGVDHVIGTRGLLADLAARGYKTTRLDELSGRAP